MPLMTSETIGSNPVNSLVKKTCDSFGLEAISFRSSRGAQATPTEKMVIPTIEVFLSQLKPSSSLCIKLRVYIFHPLVHSCRQNCLVMPEELNPLYQIVGLVLAVIVMRMAKQLGQNHRFCHQCSLPP